VQAPSPLIAANQRMPHSGCDKRCSLQFHEIEPELVAQGYDLSLNRYKEVVHAEVEHRGTHELLADLAKLETEFIRNTANSPVAAAFLLVPYVADRSRSPIRRTGHPFGFVAGSPKRSRKMDWVSVSSLARAAWRLARNASARSSTFAIRRCSAKEGSGTGSDKKMSSGSVRRLAVVPRSFEA